MTRNNEDRASRIQTRQQATELRTAGAVWFDKSDLPDDTSKEKEKERNRAKNKQAKQSRKQNRH